MRVYYTVCILHVQLYMYLITGVVTIQSNFSQYRLDESQVYLLVSPDLLQAFLNWVKHGRPEMRVGMSFQKNWAPT